MAMTTVDERLLVEAHNGGDSEAFASIVNEYSSSLYAHAMMRLGEPRAAEDAVQETFLRAYRAMPRFEGEFHLRAWLHRILTNVCFDEGDRRRREVRAFDRAAALAELDGPPADEVLDIDRAHAQREVATALASLPVAYREALELRYVEQLSFREVADVTGVSEENARARVHRGRAALRRLISRPYAFAALFIPALRKGERAAHAALSAGDSPSSVSTMSTLAQSSPTISRLAVELSGPLSTKAGIVAGVVVAATAVAAPVASNVADHTFSTPPAAVVAAPASKAAEPLASPQDTVVVVDQSPTAPVVDPATQGTPTDAAAAPTDAAAPSDSQVAGGPQTFSAPPAAAAATPAVPASGTAPPAATDPSAVTPVAPAGPLGALVSSSVVGTADGTQISINGTATLGSVNGSIGGSLAITPGTASGDPVRLDGTLTFVGPDGSMQSMRLAMRAVASTDASGVTTYLVNIGRYELTDATGATSTGSFTGSIVTGSGAASSISLSFS
jgi:RNA polymerase sigma-70 factor, ECF subfamily